MADLLHEKLHLEVVTPAARIISVDCDEVRAPGTGGGFGVRPGHTPFITSLDPGVLTYVVGGMETRFAVAGGFCEVAENRVTILADFAQPAARINHADAVKEHAEAVRRMHELQHKDEAAFRREAALVRNSAAKIAATRSHG